MNEEHVRVVRQGAKAIAEWRAKHPDENLDLRQANLSEADLLWADLNEADLRWANLSEANLRWADLREANLSWANLSEANLRWADLRRTDLTGAQLTGADLTGARWDVTAVPDLAKTALERVRQQPAGWMRAFHREHDCGTTHCLAGWACVLEGGDPAAAASRGSRIWARSEGVVPDFFGTDKGAIDELEHILKGTNNDK